MNNRTNTTIDRFPANIFFIYIVFYAGQAMYNVYLGLFLTDSGFSMTAIGTVQSVSTIALVLIQPIWGIISDKSKSKNQIVGILLIATSLVCLSFYMFKTSLWLAFCVLLFNVFFTPSFTLQDNYTLELLDDSKWDFGHIRLGGTLGYAICSVLLGFIIGSNYGSIFWMMSIIFAITGVLYFMLPRVGGHREKQEKVKYSVLLKDKPLICMVIFNIVYYMGTSFYFQFYSIYFNKTLGASSQMVGMLSFVSALSEVPFFWFAYKIEKRFGAKNVMIFAGSATALRWLLLFFITDPSLVLITSALSGCGYVGFSYCLIKYINDTVPKGIRATAQSFNAIVGTIFSRIIFAPIGGALAQAFGIRRVLLVLGFITIGGVFLFKVTFTRVTNTLKEQKEQEQKWDILKKEL